MISIPLILGASAVPTVNEMLIVPVLVAVVVNSCTIALLAAPAAAMISKFVSTRAIDGHVELALPGCRPEDLGEVQTNGVTGSGRQIGEGITEGRGMKGRIAAPAFGLVHRRWRRIGHPAGIDGGGSRSRLATAEEGIGGKRRHRWTAGVDLEHRPAAYRRDYQRHRGRVGQVARPGSRDGQGPAPVR